MDTLVNAKACVDVGNKVRKFECDVVPHSENQIFACVRNFLVQVSNGNKKYIRTVCYLCHGFILFPQNKYHFTLLQLTSQG